MAFQCDCRSLRNVSSSEGIYNYLDNNESLRDFLYVFQQNFYLFNTNFNQVHIDLYYLCSFALFGNLYMSVNVEAEEPSELAPKRQGPSGSNVVAVV